MFNLSEKEVNAKQEQEIPLEETNKTVVAKSF
jgi:hypothetical protein